MARPNSKRDGSPVKAGPKRTRTSKQPVKMKSWVPNGFMMDERKEPPATVPTGKLLKERLDKVDQLERRSDNLSDPFMFNRMRTHVKVGIETFD